MRAQRTRGAPLGGVLFALLPAALLALLFAAVGIVHVTARVMVVDQGYRLSEMEQQVRRLEEEDGKLALELATQKSPARLEKLARERLGMIPPPASAVLSARAKRPLVAGRRPDSERSAAP